MAITIQDVSIVKCALRYYLEHQPKKCNAWKRAKAELKIIETQQETEITRKLS